MYTLKKSLGQHFLKDDSVSQKIVDTLKPLNFSNLLEVGPGGGALTKYLRDIQGIDFRMVEIDQEKIQYLRQAYSELSSKIIEGDILEIEVPFPDKFTLIGNFPYNISTQIVFKIIDWREQVEHMVGMFQKEVGMRICSGPGSKEYGILSVLTQAYYHVDYLFDVDQECFNPPPKVKSGVIKFEYAGNPYQISSHRKFMVLVKAAFGQRRKQLRNPLKPYFKPEILKEDIFTKRAEQLSVADFVELLNKMN